MLSKRAVILIDGASRADLGVTRSLGAAGVPVHLLVSRRGSVTAKSRHVRAVHTFPGHSAPDGERVRRLRQVAGTFSERPVVLATGDGALRFLSRNRHALEDVLDHGLAAAEVVETVMDKRRFAVAAGRAGLSIPATFVPEGLADLRAHAGRLPYPAYVKPAHREVWSGLPPGRVVSNRGERVDSPEALLRLGEALGDALVGRVVVQELIAGPDSEELSVHAFRTPAGVLAGAFTGWKVRIWPPHAGLGAFVVSRREPEAIVVAETALAALGYTGFAIVNCKRDAATGTIRILEINGRHSTWTALPTHAGCNFPAAAYASITGAPLPVLQQREGIAWIDFARDLQSMRTYQKTGEWTWMAWARSLMQVRCWAFLEWSDPGPFLHELIHRDAG